MITIYGIQRDNECLYVGCTDRDYKVRWSEHKRDLKNGKHSNKSLQKEYIKDSNIEFKVLGQYKDDTSMVKFMAESLWISFVRPKCNKVVIQQGKSMVVLARCNQELAKTLIDVLDSDIGI